MILLDSSNNTIEEILIDRYNFYQEEKKVKEVDCTICDYDKARFCLRNEDSEITVSLSLSYYEDLKKYGVEDYLKSIYGEYKKEKALDGFDITVSVNLASFAGDFENLARQISRLKVNCIGGLYKRFFENQSQGNNNEKAVIHLRNDETLFVQSSSDRVTIVFSTRFVDSDDLVLSRTFLQEFTEARRKIATAPQVLYSQKSPPVELKGTDAIVGENVAHITYILFPRHFSVNNEENCVNLIHSFRNYLHYHIKCSKAYLQMRMRAKTIEFMKILNRAQKDEPKNCIVKVALQGAEVEKAAELAVAYGSANAAVALKQSA